LHVCAYLISDDEFNFSSRPQGAVLRQDYDEEGTMGKKFWANILLCVFIGIVLSLVLANIGSALTPKGILASDPKPSAVAAALFDKVVLADYNLSEDQGQMVTGDFIVTNTSGREVKNINVQCEFFDGDGKYLDREEWLLSGRVPTGKTMRHTSVARRYVNTASKNMKCSIVDFEVAHAPFFVLHRLEGGHGEEAAKGGHGEAPAHH
jgi:hypothetical protein